MTGTSLELTVKRLRGEEISVEASLERAQLNDQLGTISGGRVIPGREAEAYHTTLVMQLGEIAVLDRKRGAGITLGIQGRRGATAETSPGQESDWRIEFSVQSAPGSNFRGNVRLLD